MSEDAKSKGGHSWAIWIAVVLVLYVLSVGPTIALWARCGESEGVFQAILILYSPVLLLEKAPIVSTALEDYVEWWYEDVGGGSTP